MQSAADYTTAQYDKWSPIVQESLTFNASTNVETVNAVLLGDTPGNDGAFHVPKINIVDSKPTPKEVLSQIHQCDACIFQLDPTKQSVQNVWKTLDLINNANEKDGRAGKPIQFDLYSIFPESLVQRAITAVWKLQTTNVWKWMSSSYSKPWEKPKLDTMFTELVQSVIKEITDNTQCKSGWEVADSIKTATSFLLDIPIGKILQNQHIQQIKNAKSVIEFPFKKLMCGDTKKIEKFHENWLTNIDDEIEYVHFMSIDLDQAINHKLTVSLNFDALHESGIIILGLSGRAEWITNRVALTDIDHVEYLNSLGLIVLDRNHKFTENIITLRDIKLNGAEMQIVLQNVSSGATEVSSGTKVKTFKSTERHLVLLEIQNMNQQQHAKQLVHRVSHDVGGMMLKVVQVFAMREDVISSQLIRDAFKKAQDSNPERPLSKVHEVLKQEFGPQKYQQFQADYNVMDALKVGTVGQIHIANSTMPNGEDRILKVVFHEEQSEIWNNQWELLEMIGSSEVIPIIHQCWNTISVLKDNLFGEMNFKFESKYTKMARAILGGDDPSRSIVVRQEMKAAIRSMKGFTVTDSFIPCDVVQIDDKFSTPHVMMQHKASGSNLKEWLSDGLRTFSQKTKVFRSLILWWGYLAMQHGVVHSDPHYGNIMVSYDPNDPHRDPKGITFIDWGQTDTFVLGQDDEEDIEWFITFKKLLIKMDSIYDSNQIQFAENVERLVQNLQREFQDDDSGLLHLAEKVLLEPMDTRTTFRNAFLSDLAAVMKELGFESEHNSPRLLAGLALGAFNNDPRFSGADKTQEAVAADPLKVFPKNAALLFRAVTGIAGMLDDQHSLSHNKSASLTNHKTLVSMLMPFVKAAN